MTSKTRPPILWPILVASLVGGVASAYGSEAFRHPAPETDVLEAMRQVVERIPSRTLPPVVDQGAFVADVSPYEREFDLDANECVSWVVGAQEQLFHARIYGGTLGADDTVSRETTSASIFSYCSLGVPETITLQLSFDDTLGSMHFLFEERRAPTTEFRNLNALSNDLYSPDYLAARWRQWQQQRRQAREQEGTGQGALDAAGARPSLVWAPNSARRR